MKRLLKQCIRSFATMPGCDFVPPEYTGKSKEEYNFMRNEYVNPSHFLLYDNPIMITDGHMQYLYDETGKQYLDMLAGFCTVSVGHCHPRVVASGMEQMQKLQHTTTIYANPNIAELSKLLISKMPDHLETVFFTNSGSESTDLALLLARLATDNYDVISLRSSYHGMSHGAMGVTAFSSWKFEVPQGHGIKRTMWPNTYRGLFSDLPEEEQVEKYLQDLECVLNYETSGQVAGFIAEPIMGVGGSVKMPAGYLKGAYELVRNAGGVCISDEVQTAFGRLGTHYWGFEEMGVLPDIVTMAKGLGNGHPIGAVATTREIGEKLTQKLFFNTFGGNPVSMAVGKAVLEVIEEDGTQENSLQRGAQFKAGLEQLQQKHELIGQVRGTGLHLGVELVTDRETKEPAMDETVRAVNQLKDMGVLVGIGGLQKNVFRINPPMCVSADDIDFTVECFDEVLSNL